MFVLTWCPKQASELQLHISEDFEYVSFGKVRAVCVLSCNVLYCRMCGGACGGGLTVLILRHTGNPFFQVQIVKISAFCGIS